MNPARRERASLANDLAAIYIATQVRQSLMGDHLAAVAGILLALLCGTGPFILLYCLDRFGAY
jgi:hypothetical protein